VKTGVLAVGHLLSKSVFAVQVVAFCVPMELNTVYTIPANDADVFSARFSPRGDYLALGLGDGTISIHNAKTGKPLTLVPVATSGSQPGGVAAPSTMGLPITALRWRPEVATQFKVSEATTAKDVLLAAGSDGVIRHVHANSGRVLSTIVDLGNQLFAADYRAFHFGFRLQWHSPLPCLPSLPMGAPLPQPQLSETLHTPPAPFLPPWFPLLPHAAPPRRR
jgi:WD40 repeat protein